MIPDPDNDVRSALPLIGRVSEPEFAPPPDYRLTQFCMKCRQNCELLERREDAATLVLKFGCRHCHILYNVKDTESETDDGVFSEKTIRLDQWLL